MQTVSADHISSENSPYCFIPLWCDLPSILDTFSKPAPGSSSDGSQTTGWMNRLTVGAYKPYFDVDTSDVLERIKDSLFPFKATFTEKTVNNPDLYVTHFNFNLHGYFHIKYSPFILHCQTVVRNYLIPLPLSYFLELRKSILLRILLFKNVQHFFFEPQC